MRFYRSGTDLAMDKQKRNGPVSLCVIPICLFWIPLLFFLGAANTLDTCDDEFVLWLKIYGVTPLSVTMFVQIVGTFWACKGSGMHFKNVLRFQGLSMLTQLALCIWGWVEYSQTSAGECVGEDDVNPRKLALAFLIMGSIFAPCSFCMAYSAIKNPVAAEQAVVQGQQQVAREILADMEARFEKAEAAEATAKKAAAEQAAAAEPNDAEEVAV